MQIICTLAVVAAIIALLLCLVIGIINEAAMPKPPRTTCLDDGFDEKRDFLLNDEDESMMENRLRS